MRQTESHKKNAGVIDAFFQRLEALQAREPIKVYVYQITTITDDNDQ